MSYCSICGTVEWHDVIRGVERTTYCPKCQPKGVPELPLDEGNDYDIDESEVIHGMPVHTHGSTTDHTDPDCPACHAPINGPNMGIASTGKPISFDVADSPADFAIIGAGEGKATTLTVDGSKVITAYDELPNRAAQGQMAVKKGEDITYVYDGEEWQNLGEALLGKKRSTLTPRDEKIDRRAAIAATKAKND